MARKQYPSDRRRFIKIKSANLADDTADLSDAEFRTWILLLAEHNELTAQNGEEWIHIAKSRLPSVSPNKRGSVATSARVVRELCTKRALSIQEGDTKWSIQVLKPEQNQSTTPPELRDNSVQTPGNKNKNKNKNSSGEMYDGSGEEHGEYRLQKGHYDLAIEAIDAMINKRPSGKPLTRHQVAVWYVWKRTLVMDDYTFPKTGESIKNFRSTARRWFNNSMFKLEDIDEAMKWVRLTNVFNREAELEANQATAPEHTKEEFDAAEAGW